MKKIFILNLGARQHLFVEICVSLKLMHDVNMSLDLMGLVVTNDK